MQEIRLKIKSKKPGALEILKDVLIAKGISLYSIAELMQGKNQYLVFYPKTSSQVSRINQALKEVNPLGFCRQTRTLRKKDWQDRWKKDFKPFELGKNFFIIPFGWSKKKYNFKKRIPITIDTSMAFGSGLHETTRFMASFIEDYCAGVANFLDIGTGTGILSMVAAKCAIKEVHAFDFNPDCVKVAKGNFKKNNCGLSRVAVADIYTYPSRKQYDFVAANLITHNLIEVGSKLVSLACTGKYLAVSGISLENLSKLKTAFKKYPLQTVKILKGKEWAAVLYQKKG